MTAEAAARPLLAVEGLSIVYRGRRETVHAVTDVTVAVDNGGSLGLVGESGCGKSTLAMGLLGLLPPTADMTATAVRFRGRELAGLGDDALRALRWKEIAFVPQSAISSLNPIATIHDQFREAWDAHGGGSAEALRTRAEELFRWVELEPRWLDAYPHELSGGMRQRAIIAMSLLFSPSLLVADEPTTALDVIVQRQVLTVFRRLRREHSMALIFVSHDIAVIAELCRSVAVMYAGRMVEIGPTRALFHTPLHPYTMALGLAFPDIRAPERALISIPGRPPALDRPVDGCAFAARCPFAQGRCRLETPPLRPFPGGQQVACHFAEEAAAYRARMAAGEAWPDAATDAEAP